VVGSASSLSTCRRSGVRLSIDETQQRNPPSFHYGIGRRRAYGFNGQDLTVERGVPVRMRVARQLGQKSVKYLTRISLVDSLKHIRDGLGSGSPSVGFSWYVGI
jgi:hypothetical protein